MPRNMRSIGDILFALPVLHQPEGETASAQIIAQMFCTNFDGNDPVIFISTLPDNLHVPLVGAYPRITFLHQLQCKDQILVYQPFRIVITVEMIQKNELHTHRRLFFLMEILICWLVAAVAKCVGAGGMHQSNGAPIQRFAYLTLICVYRQ